MSNFKVNEIKSWAKNHGISLKKHGDGYVWAEDGGDFAGKPEPLDNVVTSIFNKITLNKFLDHQRNYRPSHG